jgi:4-amino-4-deoxy-L-arabinose transferase-like glycosyltransferase
MPFLNALSKFVPKTPAREKPAVRGKRLGVPVILLIVLFALAVRLFYFVGINYAMDQDEGIYLDLSRAAMKGEYRVDFTKVPADYIPNPAEAFQFRYPMILIPAACFKVFGVCDASAVVFALLCSLGMVVITHRLARFFMEENWALMAALMLAIFPLDILYSTRLMPDVPLAFFFWLAVYLLVRADRAPNPAGWRPTWARDGRFLAAGLAVGMCYFIKLSTVFIGGVMAVYLLMEWRFKWRYGLVALGFLIVLCVEGFHYQSQGDSFLLNMKMNTRVFTQKFTTESPLKIAVIPGVFNFWLIDPTETWFYTRQILASFNPLKPSLLGGFWTVSIVAVAVMAWRRDRKLWLPGAWFVALYLMLEFTPVRLSFNQDGAWVNHYLVSQRMRYLTIAAVPAAMLCAYMVMKVRVIWLRVALVGFLAATSVEGTAYFCSWLRAGVISINQAGELLEAMPKRPIYTDYLARNHLQYRFAYRDEDRLKSFEDMPPVPHDCFVVVGGTRGMDMSSEEVDMFKAQALKHRDASWVELTVLPNPAQNYYPASPDLTIYYVP